MQLTARGLRLAVAAAGGLVTASLQRCSFAAGRRTVYGWDAAGGS